MCHILTPVLLCCISWITTAALKDPESTVQQQPRFKRSPLRPPRADLVHVCAYASVHAYIILGYYKSRERFNNRGAMSAFLFFIFPVRCCHLLLYFYHIVMV